MDYILFLSSALFKFAKYPWYIIMHLKKFNLLFKNRRDYGKRASWWNDLSLN